MTEVDASGARGRKFVERLPKWMGSIRFRLTVLYSVVLFGLAAIVVGGIYWGLSTSLDNEPVSQNYTLLQLFPTPRGLVVAESEVRATLRDVESLANERALEKLRTYTFGAIGVLFVGSLAVGWFVSGRALRPIGRITAVARNIQATDLSRRINLGGPNDELRRLADTFDGMLQRLDSAFEGQRRFIQEASHELRNPLAVIRTNLEVTSADPGSSVEDYEQTCEVVSRSVERMGRVVDDLLVYARHEAVPERHAPVDVGRLIAGMADEFSGMVDAKGIEIESATATGVWVEGDIEALRQALANLITNAVRVAPAGTAIRLGAGSESGWAWMAVEDRGPGIAVAEQERIFQRFERGEQAEYEGAGLGLTIVRQIAEAHRGEVRLASVIGSGSTFTIWIPELVTNDPSVQTTEMQSI
jgi:signal transduction histidine kinase